MRTLITLSSVALAAAAQGQLVSSSGSVSPSRAEPGDLDVARGKKESDDRAASQVRDTPGGAGTVQLHRMGDGAAVQLIRIFGSRPLNEQELTNSLDS